jgi:hypothetical protein
MLGPRFCNGRPPMSISPDFAEKGRNRESQTLSTDVPHAKTEVRMARPTPENGKVAPPKRVANRERRTREHLTPQEVDPNAISACCSAAFHLEFHINVCQQRREHPTLGPPRFPEAGFSRPGLVGPLPVRLVTGSASRMGSKMSLSAPCTTPSRIARIPAHELYRRVCESRRAGSAAADRCARPVRPIAARETRRCRPPRSLQT